MVHSAALEAVSVGPVAEAFIFGGLSAISFPIGALVAASIRTPSKHRSQLAALLAFSAGAVLQSLVHDVFGAAASSYLARATLEQEVASKHPLADPSDLSAASAESGEKMVLPDETAHCALVSLMLLCALSPVGGALYCQAHRLATGCARSRCDDAEQATPAPSGDQQLALALLVAQLVDVVPASALISLFVVRHELSLVLLCSLALANFPAAMSVALLGRGERVAALDLFSVRGSLGTWAGLCFATAALAALFARLFLCLFPTLSGHVGDDYVFAAVEGLSAGAMLVVVVSQYLPDSGAHVGPGNTGLLVVTGVVAATVLKAVGGVVSLGAGREGGLVDIPNLTTSTKPLSSWGFGGAAMPQ